MKVQSFLGLELSNGLGSWSLGLDVEGWDWTSLLIAMMNLRVAASSGFIVLAGVLLGVSPSVGSMCMDSGFVEWCADLCADDMGMGVGGCDRV